MIYKLRIRHTLDESEDDEFLYINTFDIAHISDVVKKGHTVQQASYCEFIVTLKWYNNTFTEIDVWFFAGIQGDPAKNDEVKEAYEKNYAEITNELNKLLRQWKVDSNGNRNSR